MSPLKYKIKKYLKGLVIIFELLNFDCAAAF